MGSSCVVWPARHPGSCLPADLRLDWLLAGWRHMSLLPSPPSTAFQRTACACASPCPPLLLLQLPWLQERELLPFDFLHKKRQRGHDGVALDAESDDGAAAAAPPSPRGSDGGAADSDSSDDGGGSSSSSGGGAGGGGGGGGGSSRGISWRSGSTGSSLPHLGGMAAADILDSYMRELLHNTIPCLGEGSGLTLTGLAGWQG